MLLIFNVVDINECCLDTDGCTHTCTNTDGSSCNSGYRLASVMDRHVMISPILNLQCVPSRELYNIPNDKIIMTIYINFI